MTTQQFIEKAIKGGWKYRGYEQYPQEVEFLPSVKDGDVVKEWNPYWFRMLITTNHFDGKPFNAIKQERVEYILLDPEAWKAVGKVEGWKDCAELGYVLKYGTRLAWLSNWHGMIAALAEGKTAEQYLETL